MASIEAYAQPPKLFRYRSLRNLDREIDALENRYLHCSRYSDLNDPMEGLFSSSRFLKASKNYRTVRRAVTDSKSNIGICSFSEVHNHELMWAHYANQFRGICIEYRLSKLLNQLKDDVAFVRMFYNETEPTLHRTKKHPDDLARMILSYKNHRWLYEREWRMLARPGMASYDEVECVTRVYLGFRIDEDERNELLTRLNALKIKTSDMTINKYSIGFEPTSKS